MKSIAKTKSFLVSVFLLLVGVVSLAMESIFYGDIDRDGVLQESFFLPLGSFGLLLGVAGIIGSVIWFYLTRKKPPGSGGE